MNQSEGMPKKIYIYHGVEALDSEWKNPSLLAAERVCIIPDWIRLAIFERNDPASCQALGVKLDQVGMVPQLSTALKNRAR